MRKLVVLLLFFTFSAMSAGQTTNESQAVGALRTLNTAQVQYMTTYMKLKGYACSLEQLGPPKEGSKPSQRAAGLVSAKLASGVIEGYRIELKCVANDYQAFAAPTEQSGRVFCIDKSAVVRTSDSADTCIKEGTVPEVRQ